MIEMDLRLTKGLQSVFWFLQFLFLSFIGGCICIMLGSWLVKFWVRGFMPLTF